MKKVVSLIITLCLVAMLSMAVLGATKTTANSRTTCSATSVVAQPISAAASQQIVGGWIAEFFAGVACGAGIVAIGAGALSGVGLPAAILGVTGVAAACAAAL